MTDATVPAGKLDIGRVIQETFGVIGRNFVTFAVPIRERFVATDVSRQRVGLSRAQHRLQNGPNPVSVVGSRGTD